MNIFKNIIYTILSVQEKILKKRLERTLGAKNNSKRKNVKKYGCFLSLETLADSEKAKIEDEILLILKSANYNPEEVLEYIKKHGTSVCYVENANMLYSVCENEGFIYPQTGLKALYLNLITNKKMSLKIPEMFVLTRGTINKYYFIYHFYNWYAFKHNIEGLDSESQALLKKFLYSENDDDFKKLQLSEIYKLKDAIKQDKSAIEFVFKLCQKYDTAKKALEKIKDNGANI